MGKGLGFALLVLTGTLSGRYFSKRAHKRIRELESFIHLFSAIRTQISYALTPTLELLADLQANDRTFANFRFLQLVCERLQNGSALPEAWYASVTAYQSRSALSADALCCISEFGAALGNTDKEGQQANCAYFVDRLEELKAQELKQLPNTTKLCNALGALGGVFLGILLL